MLAAWRYRERATLIQSLDPRARLVFSGCLGAALLQVWSLPWLAALFAVCLAQYFLARLTLRETARFWIFAGTLAVVLTVLSSFTHPDPHGIPWLRLGPLALTRGQGIHAVAQLWRILSLSLLAVILPFTIHPAQYGVTFRGLGLPDRLAVATDLSVRFVPTFVREFANAVDAQKARGFELDRAAGVLRQARNLAPLIIPVTINAILGAEEIVDAMELRGFGAGPRTWFVELTWRPRDTVLVTAGSLLLLGITWEHLAGRIS